MEYLGIDVGGTTTKMAILSKNELKNKAVFETKKDYNAFCKDLTQKILEYIKEYPIRAIGIGIPGFVNMKTNQIKQCSNLGWKNIDIVTILTERIKIPIYLINDVTGAAFGEWKIGSLENKKEAIYIALGTGIGGAAIANGSLIFGADGGAGEFGHHIIKFDGKKCSCGKLGCLEAYSASWTVEKEYKERKNKVLTFKQIYEIQDTDEIAKEIIEQYYIHLGIGIENLITIYNPEIISIGGGISNIGDDFIKRLKKEIDSNVQLVIGNLKEDAGMYGIAMFAEEMYQKEEDRK